MDVWFVFREIFYGEFVFGRLRFREFSKFMENNMKNIQGVLHVLSDILTFWMVWYSFPVFLGPFVVSKRERLGKQKSRERKFRCGMRTQTESRFMYIGIEFGLDPTRVHLLAQPVQRPGIDWAFTPSPLLTSVPKSVLVISSPAGPFFLVFLCCCFFYFIFLILFCFVCLFWLSYLILI